MRRLPSEIQARHGQWVLDAHLPPPGTPTQPETAGTWPTPTSHLDRVLASLGVRGPVAVVNAGWQERETDGAEILSLAGGQAVNLRLYSRWMDVLSADPEHAVAEREHRLVLDELQQLHQVRLEPALQAVSAVAGRSVGQPTVRSTAVEDALTAVRLLAATHLTRVQERHDTCYGTWRLEERGAIAGHREEAPEESDELGPAKTSWVRGFVEALERHSAPASTSTSSTPTRAPLACDRRTAVTPMAGLPTSRRSTTPTTSST